MEIEAMNCCMRRIYIKKKRKGLSANTIHFRHWTQKLIIPSAPFQQIFNRDIAGVPLLLSTAIIFSQEQMRHVL